ncbi:MAG: S9 family peptidase, partial [Mycobacterium sp.]
MSGGNVYCLESRPAESGRVVVVRRGLDGAVHDVTPPGWSARSRVHEYGGGSYLVWQDAVIFSNWQDQRLWRQDGLGTPHPLTPETPPDVSVRYADGRMVPGGRFVACVRETHPPEAGPSGVVNEIVLVPAGGAGAGRAGAGGAGAGRAGAGRAGTELVVVTGNDFYAAPRPSQDGGRLAWISWDHPYMPWDSSELWVASISPGGALGSPLRIAGGEGESVLQPTWGPSGELWFVSDRSGWWNLYR